MADNTRCLARTGVHVSVRMMASWWKTSLGTGGSVPPRTCMSDLYATCLATCIVRREHEEGCRTATSPPPVILAAVPGSSLSTGSEKPVILASLSPLPVFLHNLLTTYPRPRRKKIRCSGERPTCAFCRRCAQPCQYQHPPSTANTFSPVQWNGGLGQSPRVSGVAGGMLDEHRDHMSHRLASLEEQLKLLTQSNRAEVTQSDFAPISPPYVFPDHASGGTIELTVLQGHLAITSASVHRHS